MRGLVVLTAALSLCGAGARAADAPGAFGFGSDVRYSARLKPQDYLFAPNPERRNDLFETLRPVDLGVNLGIGSDCGKINIEGTFHSTFGKFLSGDYFKGVAQDILGSAPMLAACYMSPTWCAILKHTQMSANFLTQTRLSVPDHRQVRRFPRRGLLSGAAILRAAVDSTQRRRHGIRARELPERRL